MSEIQTETLLLLHGFGGTHRAWDGLIAKLGGERYRALALDLPGHGGASAVRPLTLAACAQQVLAAAPDRFAVAGYSMGGRVALHVALAAPQRVSRLALVSSTAGIDDAAAREQRRRDDARLAAELEREPYEAMIARWRSQPLFADDPPQVSALAAADQRRNDPRDLADSLRQAGSGEMEPLWDRLGELQMPALVVAGERDAKFTALARRLAGALPHATLRILPGGHVLALESPRELARALQEW